MFSIIRIGILRRRFRDDSLSAINFSILSRILALIISSFLVAACNPAQQARMGSYGIGTELYSAETPAAARNLDAYLGYLCWQAGFQTSGYVDFSSGEPRCVDAYLTERQWKLVVLTGWNDIDRRCDSYLAWLDNQRRTRVFVNDMFTHVGLLTTGLFSALDTGKKTVNIVALALGFGNNLYSSHQNRVLIEIEGSTLEAVVVDRRLDFRELIASAPIESKPAAVKVLRDYLRICTPYGIKISINTFSRSRATGAPLLENREIQVLRQSLLESAIGSVNDPLRRAPRFPPNTETGPRLAIRVGDQEQALGAEEIEHFQRVLCVKVDGQFNIETKAAVLDFLIKKHGKKDNLDRITPVDRDTMMDENPPSRCPG